MDGSGANWAVGAIVRVHDSLRGFSLSTRLSPVYFSALCIPVWSTYWNLLLDVLTGYSTVWAYWVCIYISGPNRNSARPISTHLKSACFLSRRPIRNLDIPQAILGW